MNLLTGSIIKTGRMDTYWERGERNVLNIYFGDMKDAIYNTNVYFQNQYQDSWITKPLSREMILDVDKSEVVSAELIQSPVLGAISPRELSGGVKTLLLMANDKKHIFNASTCGDNCAKWILRLAQKEKLVINLRHLMDFGPGEFKIRILNTGKIVKNMAELISQAGELV